jgi:hypothetical protein
VTPRPARAAEAGGTERLTAIEVNLDICRPVVQVGQQLELHDRADGAVGSPTPRVPANGFEVGVP